MIKLSVIIPTRNRASYLELTLKSITKQNFSMKEYEVIVINNGSTDNTRQVCMKYKKIFDHFHYIFVKCPGLHIGRNLGYQYSKSDLLVYADDDIYATKSWLHSIYEGFQNEKIDLIGGNIRPYYIGKRKSWLNDFIYTEKGFNICQPLSCIWSQKYENSEISPYYIFGCNFSVRKRIIEKCNGFHPDGMPLDLLMYRGDGETYISQYIFENLGKAVFIPGADIWHIINADKLKEQYFYSIGFRNGISDMYNILRNKNLYAGFDNIFFSISAYKSLIKNNKIYNKYLLHIIKGKLYLLIYYIFYPQIRFWILKKNYLISPVRNVKK